MKLESMVTGAVVLACAVSVSAEKLPRDFRDAFERAFPEQRAYAVVLEEGIPTTSIYGIQGDQTAAHYSVDIIEGGWKTSGGLLDLNQEAVDFLSVGEILQLDSISYKNNRVDLRMVSTEAHQVSRGSWPSSSKGPEPVATNFKFFLPFDESRRLTSADFPEVRDYIEDYLKFFDDRDEARRYAARLIAGDPPPKATAKASSGATSRKQIEVGMTPLQVLEILGKPEQELVFEDSSKWTYPDLTVIFEQGRVKEVRF